MFRGDSGQPGAHAISFPVDEDIRGVLVAADVVDEVEADAAGAGVVEVAVEAERAEVAGKLLCEERGRDAAARVAALVRAQEHNVVVGAGVGCERAAAGGGGGR